MLARIPDARATRDLYFAICGRESADEALAEMRRVAAIDLGNWCSFRLTKHEESIDENGYLRLLRLRFATYVGRDEKDPVLIDLSLDCSTTLPPERITPASRLSIEGLENCDYLVYPLPDQLADKLCAIMETQPGGYPSSRMKDLVDVVTYVRSKRFELGQLRRAIESECAKRSMAVPERFVAPPTWQERFEAFAKRNGVTDSFATLQRASDLAARFFDPALIPDANSTYEWGYSSLRWRKGHETTREARQKGQSSSKSRQHGNKRQLDVAPHEHSSYFTVLTTMSGTRTSSSV